MTIEREISPQKGFVPARLPWLIAAGALVLFLATLNHWLSLANMGNVSRLSGWTWQPELSGPLYWLATCPLRWLPAKAIPLALNLFSAICAFLTLVLLARSVALLPHDRTEEERSREHGAFALLSIRTAWLPPLLAVLVCGLQLTFWEDATGGSAEMLDLLIFAYVIRCLLEFRVDERQSWLFRAALVYGLGMANNWAMVAFLPVFVVAVVWMKGFGFFNLGFLTRMFLWALAGLSLYLLMPLVWNAAATGRIPFWQGLGASLRADKNNLATVIFNKYSLFTFEKPLWVMGLFSFLPLLVMGIKWPSYFGDPSRLGVSMATFVFHCFHAVLLVVCIWLALDPAFSPRHNGLMAAYKASGLPIYYLAALGVGYLAGYFLLVFGVKPTRPPRPIPPYMNPVNRLVRLAVWLLLLLAPATLIYRNLPQIRLTNGPLLKDYAALTMQGLPDEKAVVLSDDPFRLELAQVAAAQEGKNQNYVFVDTRALVAPDYHRFLQKKYPDRWPGNPAKDDKQRVGDFALVDLMYRLSQTNSLYYLHPSFGYYFEVFYPESHGLVYRLNKFPTNTVTEVPPSAAVVSENEDFWRKAGESVLSPVLVASAPASTVNPGLMDRVVRLAHLQREQNNTVSLLASCYSRALDFWGVEMQRSGHLSQAGSHFARARELNPDNVAAQVNLEFNKKLASGNIGPLKFSKSMEDKLGKYRNLQEALNVNGPFDDAEFCYAQALIFARGGLYRESAREFVRVKALMPDQLPARLFLAEIYLKRRMPEKALEETDQIRAQAALLDLSRTNLPAVLNVELSAHLARRDVTNAERVLQAALRQYPGDTTLLAVGARAFLNYRCYTNALATLEQELKIAPDSSGALINQGYIYLQLKDYDKAIAPLTRVLDRQATNGFALLDRGVAYLNLTNLDAAQRDYEALGKSLGTARTNAFAVDFGLAEIAYHRKDAGTALQHYSRYLAIAPTNNPALKAEIEIVRAHLKELQPSP